MFDPLLILCGGLSRRMGQSKPLLMYQGQSLIERHIRAYTRSPIYLASAGQRFDLPTELASAVHYVDDALAGHEGALSGILSGLSLAKSQEFAGLYVMACDTLLNPNEIVGLLSSAKGSDEAWQSGVVYVKEGDRAHPLQSHWSTQMMGELHDYLHSGERRVQVFIQQYPHYACSMPSSWQFLSNFNTPADFEQAIQKSQQ